MVKRILIFDNYDSFTQNLYNLLKTTQPSHEYYILRNKDENVLTLDFDVLIISPGPMKPTNTGLLTTLFKEKIVPFAIPVFGVCLGMQYIATYFGEQVIESDNALHGSAVEITHCNTDIFSGIRNPFFGARYNSLEVNKNMITNNIQVLAEEKLTKSIMGLKHKNYPFVGVQFHPESFLTQQGFKIIDNFFQLYMEN